jgi:copper resistance protein D
MDEALVAVRAVHFVSTAMIAGLLIFLVVVAEPVFRCAGKPDAGTALLARSLHVAWAWLALTVVSGAAWLWVQTAAISGRPLGEALADGLVWVVLNKTQFGTVSIIRSALVTVQRSE